MVWTCDWAENISHRKMRRTYSRPSRLPTPHGLDVGLPRPVGSRSCTVIAADSGDTLNSSPDLQEVKAKGFIAGCMIGGMSTKARQRPYLANHPSRTTSDYC